MTTVAREPVEPQRPAKPKKDRTHYLYIFVIAAVVAGAVLGLVAPDFAKSLKPVGTAFIAPPFGGSGTTLIAADSAPVRCRRLSAARRRHSST